jgi:hypothetical protein
MVHGSSDLVGMDLLLLHTTIRMGHLVPAAELEHMEDSFPLQAFMLHLHHKLYSFLHRPMGQFLLSHCKIL